MNSTLILKGNILYTPRPTEFISIPHGYIIAVDGVVVYCGESIPTVYTEYDVVDYGDNLIIPGFVDTHVHAPQYCNRGLGMDKELLPWLETYTFPEEAKFIDPDYARLVYGAFVHDLWRNGTTRSILFGTIHKGISSASLSFPKAQGRYLSSARITNCCTKAGFPWRNRICTDPSGVGTG